MSFWLGAMQGLTDYRQGEADRQYKETLAKQEGESKVALHLLESDDPDVQMAGMSILAAAMGTPKKKGGVRGSMGEYEQTQGLRPLLDLMNQAKAISEGPAAATPGSAALPPASPVEPKAQGPHATQPPMRFGAPTPTPDEAFAGNVEQGAEFGAATPASPFAAASMPFQPSPLSAPQAQAADMAVDPNGQISFGQIASRVSQDRSVAKPGERARLFWPTKASQAAAAERAKLDAKAEVFQRLGATPQQVLTTLMASEGNVQSAMGLTNSDPMLLPGSEQPVETFIRRNPATNAVEVVYIGPGGQLTPVPAGATAWKFKPRIPGATAGAGGSLTSYMSGAKLLEFGIADASDGINPAWTYKVNQKGDVISFLPYDAAVPPPQTTGRGINPATGAMTQANREGMVSDVPGTAPTINPRIAAARALLAGIREQERLSGIGTDLATIRAAVEREIASGRYPALRGLTFDQIAQLERLDQTTPDAALGPILRAPAMAPPPGGAPPAAPPRPQAGLTPPSAAGASTAAPAASTAAPAAGWASDIANEILAKRRARAQKPKTGVVQGGGIPVPR